MGRYLLIAVGILLVVLKEGWGGHEGPPVPQQWSKDQEVSPGYHIRWSHEDPEYLVMEMSAPTRGYVAVGFSPNGAMAGSDIVMGWVDSKTGEAYIRDMYAVGNTAPLEDDQQDCELLWAEESDQGTTIRFKRKWNTCDTREDFEITENTVRLIWAVGEADPERNPGVLPAYHGPDNRGVNSVFLKLKTHLSGFPDEAPVPDPSIQYWDVRVGNVSVYGDTDTTYHCKLFKAPELFREAGKKHQIVGFRTLIDPKNKRWVHHFNFFECTVPPHAGSSDKLFEDTLDHPGATCYTKNMPPQWAQYCITVPFVWAVGSEGMMLPEYGGVPIHEEHGGATYFLVEIHYDNPKKLDFTDNSGVRMFVTNEPRQHDFGTIVIQERFGQWQLIPPETASFRSMAYCTSECTQAILPPEGITVTHAILHAHLVGKNLTLRHIREGHELSPIAQDLHYDFNYQQSRPVSPTRKVLPGDIVMIDCEYDTRGRPQITYGGDSSRDEMCQGFLFYYPKIPLAVCKSQHEFHNFFDALGIKKVEGKEVLDILQLPYKPHPNQLFDPGDDAYVLKNGTKGTPEYPFDVMHVTDPPPEGRKLQTVREFVEALPWSKDNGQFIKKVWQQWWDGDHLALCTGPGLKRIPLENYLLKYPQYKPYERPISKQCLLQNSSAALSPSIFRHVTTLAHVVFLVTFTHIYF